jgi:hypothetical protein
MCAMLSYRDAGALFLDPKGSDLKDVIVTAKTEREQNITIFFITGSLLDVDLRHKVCQHSFQRITGAAITSLFIKEHSRVQFRILILSFFPSCGGGNRQTPAACSFLQLRRNRSMHW